MSEVSTRLFMFAIAAVMAAGQAPQLGRGLNHYSQEKEAALGAELAKGVRERTPPIDNVPVQDYVRRLGEKLAAQLAGVDLTLSFAVVADSLTGGTREPDALPGGYVFVPASLIVAAHDEAELAGMLAHAIAHIADRHATRLATRAQVANQASIPLIFMTGFDRSLIPRRLAEVQREFELTADRLAVRMLADAGYDPEALARYIERTQSGEAEAYSSMPGRDTRISAIEQAVRELHPGSSSGDEFRSIQELLRPPSRQPPSLRNR